jgi:Glycoside hydrolase family 44
MNTSSLKSENVAIFDQNSLCAVLALAFCLIFAGCGGGGTGGGGGKNITNPATGLTATAGNAEITLNWDAYPGANGYAVLRSMTGGGPYNYIDLSGTPITGTTFTDPGLVNGTTYYYEVVASTPATFSNPSNPASATPSGPSKDVAVTVDLLSNVHIINQYIYGGAFPQKLPTLFNSQSTAFVYDVRLMRWGGNASSTYNWQLGTANAGSDNFFENLTFCGIGGAATNSPCGESDSVQFIKHVEATFTFPVTTVSMLPWVAQSAASSGNGHYSFSVGRDGPQCHTDPQNSDAGDGIALTSNCDSQPNFLTATATDINAAYVPLLDDHSQACPSGNCVYRSDWVAALADAFNQVSFPHFYEMDNEMDMWGVTHRDIHPSPSGYDEMANVYLAEATKLKGWDPKAVRLGPLSCCWWLYWNGANSNDKAAHAGDDFLPWWLNQIYWHDQISSARSLDVFDIHAFPDATTTDSSGNPLPKSQLQMLAGTIYRDYWDPTFVSPSSTINQPNVTSIQPNPTIPFRIPRMRALLNTIYPGTPLAISAWRASFAGESDFSTALADADAYGIMGRENVYLASRWTAPNPANPNYWALRLYTGYDYPPSNLFGEVSVADTHNGDPNLFSSYASVGAGGNTPKIMVINKDPQNSVQVQFTLKGFSPTSFTRYALTAANPAGIAFSDTQPWSSVQYFPPYSATLLVIGGSFGGGSAFQITPDSMMVPAGGTVSWSFTGGNPTSVAFDAYEGVPACSGSIVLTGTQQLTVNAGSTPGFCHFTLTGGNGGSTQGGWVIVGNPAASLTIAGGNNQTGAKGTMLPVVLSVNLAPGSSGGANPASGASILFSTNAGTLSNGTTNNSKVIATTDSSGAASVTLTLPSSAQTVEVTAEGPYGLGHPTVTFTETSQ